MLSRYVYNECQTWSLYFTSIKTCTLNYFHTECTKMCASMECSQAAAWTSNWCLLVVSHVKVFPGRLTNSGSDIPRAAHQEGGVIGCLHPTLGGAPASLDINQPILALSHMLTNNHLHPYSPPTLRRPDQLHTCTN